MIDPKLLTAIRDAHIKLLEYGQKPTEVTFDNKYKAILAVEAQWLKLPLEKMTCFGMKVKFDSLPNGVEFIVG